MKCPNCGCEIHDPSFRFCPECRTRLPHEDNVGKTCPHCGTTNIDPSFNFCPKCRGRLTSDDQSVTLESNPEEKGFLNRLFKTYEKAVKDPAAFIEWAKKNPNDSAVLLAKWSREGKDISMFAAVNPMLTSVDSQSDKAEPVLRDKRKHDGKMEEPLAVRQQNIAARESFSVATGGAADLIKNKAIWQIVPGEVARHITPQEFEVVSDSLEGVLIEQGTSAIIYVDGQEVAQLASGLYTFATEKVTQQVTEEILKDEKKEKDNLFRRTIGRVVRFFMGTKKGEEAEKREERKNRIKTITRRITGQSVVSVYLKADREFSATFGAEPNEDGSLGFKPYRIATANVDVEVGLDIKFRIADFKDFIAYFMLGKKSVSIADIQRAADPVVKALLRYQLRNVPVDERGIPDPALDVLKENMLGENDALRGIEITRVVEIRTHNEGFDRLRFASQQLYLSEREMDSMIRTNEFQNRLESEKNRQRVAEARTANELQAALDDVNKDKLLHEEEMEKFYQHYRNMQAIRQATGDLELEKALLGLQGDVLVTEDDFEAVKEGLQNKKFEREQLSEVLRMRALTNTALAKMSIEEELATAEVRHALNLRKAELNAQSEIDDVAWEAHKVDMRRDAEDVDLEAAIYGRKFVLEKQQLIDAIDLEEKRNQQRIREADVENELLDRRLAGQQKEKDQAFAEKVREYEFEHGRKADDIELERMRKQVEYDFERARKMDDAELLEREQRGALEMMRQMQEQDLKKDLQSFTHEENMLRTRATMSHEQLTADQLQHLDKEAQIAYMEARKSQKEAEIIKENEARRLADERERIRRYDEEREEARLARREDREYTRSLLETLAGALGGNVAAQAAERKAERESYERIATHRIGEVDSMKEEYKDQMRHEQARLDDTTDKALNFTSRVSSAEASRGSSAEASSPRRKESELCPRCLHDKGERHLLTDDGFCPYCGWQD